MAATHDYATEKVEAAELDNTMTLVGECGGLSSILKVYKNLNDDLLIFVNTEHGQLTMYAHDFCNILDPDRS